MLKHNIIIWDPGCGANQGTTQKILKRKRTCFIKWISNGSDYNSGQVNELVSFDGTNASKKKILTWFLNSCLTLIMLYLQKGTGYIQIWISFKLNNTRYYKWDAFLLLKIYNENISSKFLLLYYTFHLVKSNWT